MKTLDLAWCPTCLDLVTVGDGGQCPRGHAVNPDLDGPPPWVGHASADDDVPVSHTSASHGAAGGDVRPNGVDVGDGEPPRPSNGSSLLDLHLSMLQSGPAASNGASAVEADRDHDTDDDDLEALLALELGDDPSAVPAPRTSVEDDLADLLAAELDGLAGAPVDAPAAEPTAHADDDDLADLLGAELDHTEPQPTPEPRAQPMPQPGTDDDLDEFLRAELDHAEPGPAAPAPHAAAEPDWLDEPDDGDDDLALALEEALGAVDREPASFDEDPDLADPGDPHLDEVEPDPVEAGPTERPSESLDDVIKDVLASFGTDADAADTAIGDDDLVAASDLDLTATSAAALDEETMADLADLGLFDDHPDAPAATDADDGPAAGPDDDTVANHPTEAENHPTEAEPTPPPSPPAARPEQTVDLLNFTASGTGIRGLTKRRRRKSS